MSIGSPAAPWRPSPGKHLIIVLCIALWVGVKSACNHAKWHQQETFEGKVGTRRSDVVCASAVEVVAELCGMLTRLM
jgi:hypothetical protein